MEKLTIFDQNHGLAPWENFNFLTFLTSCFHRLEKRFFVQEYRVTHLPDLFSQK